VFKKSLGKEAYMTSVFQNQGIAQRLLMLWHVSRLSGQLGAVCGKDSLQFGLAGR